LHIFEALNKIRDSFSLEIVSSKIVYNEEFEDTKGPKEKVQKDKQ
jgi:hypothetical protein